MATKTPISVFCRIKPHSSENPDDIQEYSIKRGSDRDTISISCPQFGSFVNNKPEVYKFKFVKVFDQFVKQNEIYEAVAHPVVQSALEGYNGTIFAYGQTGSGKTFTITGDKDNRGIVPRALSEIFKAIEISKNKIEIHLSYLEIYNEHSNDLLLNDGEKKKITLRENIDKVMHWHNLGLCPVKSFEEAMKLLTIGDSNRIVSDTPMNMVSSRSHTILTIYITAHLEDEFVVRKAKLNLVDLAGSERVHKTGEEGIVLEEARHINLSLHYLEQVIVALSDSSRKHVPYRNCSMTSALRDSLGGNCMTVMVANIAVDKSNVEETISTCRFSQRVALVRNDLIMNTEKDLPGENSQLKTEIHQLRKQCSILQAKIRVLQKRESTNHHKSQTNSVMLSDSKCSDYVEEKDSRANSEMSVEQLQNDIVYLIGWLHDEHNYLSANIPTLLQGAYCTLTIIDPEDKFNYFINTLDEHAKDEWVNAKLAEQKAARELSSKVTLIKDVHRDILEVWKHHDKSLVRNILSEYSLEQPSSNSVTNLTSGVHSEKGNFKASCLFVTHTELMKDFKLLKSRLQSCKRSSERLKRKYVVEYNSWLKKRFSSIHDEDPSKDILNEISSSENKPDIRMINDDLERTVEFNGIERITKKVIKSNSERNISNHMKNLARYGLLISDDQQCTAFDYDVNSTFDDLNDSFLSSSTRVSGKGFDDSYKFELGIMPRAIQSAPSNLHPKTPERQRLNPFIEMIESKSNPSSLSSHVDGLTSTTFQLTGDEEVDDEIITFYKNKLSNASSDVLGFS